MSAVSTRLQTWERFAPLAGVVAVILWVVGIIVLESGGNPSDEASGQVLATHYEENSGSILAGSFLFMLGAAAFVWFLGTLRARILWSEGTVGRLAATTFGAGILTAVMAIGLAAPEAAAALSADQLDRAIEPGAADALATLGDGFFLGGEASVVVFFLAAGLASLRFRALPAWLGWVSIVFAILAVLPWIGWAVFIWGLPLWVLAASIWMFLRPTSPEPVWPAAGAV
jgi:hypothetical protein